MSSCQKDHVFMSKDHVFASGTKKGLQSRLTLKT